MVKHMVDVVEHPPHERHTLEKSGFVSLFQTCREKLKSAGFDFKPPKDKQMPKVEARLGTDAGAVPINITDKVVSGSCVKSTSGKWLSLIRAAMCGDASMIRPGAGAKDTQRGPARGKPATSGEAFNIERPSSSSSGASFDVDAGTAPCEHKGQDYSQGPGSGHPVVPSSSLAGTEPPVTWRSPSLSPPRRSQSPLPPLSPLMPEAFSFSFGDSDNPLDGHDEGFEDAFSPAWFLEEPFFF